ncbi:MAG TPA: hypothetical protein VGO47_04225 [Chlamydiales bacterium]|nr:hypothetical protein [Chlamydiales bacterium]
MRTHTAASGRSNGEGKKVREANRRKVTKRKDKEKNIRGNVAQARNDAMDIGLQRRHEKVAKAA